MKMVVAIIKPFKLDDVRSALAAVSYTHLPTTGEQAFTKVCSACHGLGINGAPKIGDHAAWGPRIAQGKDALYSLSLIHI